MLAQTDTYQPIAEWIVAISVKCYTAEYRLSRRCTEVRRDTITTPRGTPLVTVGVPGYHEAGIELFSITDQQLVRIRVVCSLHSIPQSISICNIPIVLSGRYRLVHTSLKIGLLSSLVINKDNFCKLKNI